MYLYNGKIYKLPQNFYFYKANQQRLWMEYCKKVTIPNKEEKIERDKSKVEGKNIMIILDDLWVE